MKNEYVKRLIEHPPSQPGDLGKPLPGCGHSVSVVLPTWDSVIGYEEKDPVVINALQCGYPRFSLPAKVQELAAKILVASGDEESQVCYLYPSMQAAQRCVDFIYHQTGEGSRIVETESIFAVLVSVYLADTAKAYWQHAGDGISSRHAAAILSGHHSNDEHVARHEVIRRLAEVYDVAEEQVYLFSCGMAAIWAAIRFYGGRLPADSKAIQLGFPYVDTLKLMDQSAGGTHFFPSAGPEDIAQIERITAQEKIRVVTCEVPGNPLLNTPDIHRLSQVLKKSGTPLFIDDTISACGNLDLLPHCDALTTSLTKYFSGIGDVMGGALILNADSPLNEGFKEFYEAEYPFSIWGEDLAVLANNSRDLNERLPVIYNNALALALFLAEHSAVKQVYYPALTNQTSYQKLMKPDSGYGGMLSFVLEDESKAPAVYDALECCKGPNLGMEYTLCCPFTLLAFYDELDYVEECGLSRWLIRVSAGVEPTDILISRFAKALEKVK